jgi:hypothetical protein
MQTELYNPAWLIWSSGFELRVELDRNRVIHHFRIKRNLSEAAQLSTSTQLVTGGNSIKSVKFKQEWRQLLDRSSVDLLIFADQVDMQGRR